ARPAPAPARQVPALTQRRPDEALVPAGDHLPRAQRDLERVAAPGPVERRAVAEHADVVHDDGVTRLGTLALALDEGRDLERVGRGVLRRRLGDRRDALDDLGGDLGVAVRGGRGGAAGRRRHRRRRRRGGVLGRLLRVVAAVAHERRDDEQHDEHDGRAYHDAQEGPATPRALRGGRLGQRLLDPCGLLTLSLGGTHEGARLATAAPPGHSGRPPHHASGSGLHSSGSHVRQCVAEAVPRDLSPPREPHMSNDQPDEETTPTNVTIEVGRRLRALRKARRMSLDDVERESSGRWSASAIGAYERGFRTLSLPRLHELAEFYDVSVSVLLGEQPTPTEGPPKLVLDLEALNRVPEAAPVQRFVRSIIVERGDYNGRVLTLRRDDLRAISALLQTDTADAVKRLESW